MNMPASRLPPCGGITRSKNNVTQTATKQPQPIRRLRSRGVTISATRAPHAVTVTRVSGHRAIRSRAGGIGSAMANGPPSAPPVYPRSPVRPCGGVAEGLSPAGAAGCRPGFWPHYDLRVGGIELKIVRETNPTKKSKKPTVAYSRFRGSSYLTYSGSLAYQECQTL